MEITYDPNKNQQNIKERNLPFDDVISFRKANQREQKAYETTY